MAKLVECHLSEVAAQLVAHERGWLLVAVVARRRPPAIGAAVLAPEWKWEEWRELYFERELQ